MFELTGVQALCDSGGLDQVTSAQVTGDEVVEIPHHVPPSRSSHVWSTVLFLDEFVEIRRRQS